MDEKGNQMGGGRKNPGTKFIFSAEDSDRYRIHSDNLELVTIIECVSAAGAKMPPLFVLSDGPAPDNHQTYIDNLNHIMHIAVPALHTHNFTTTILMVTRVFRYFYCACMLTVTAELTLKLAYVTLCDLS
jgi:hypothetical protein